MKLIRLNLLLALAICGIITVLFSNAMNTQKKEVANRQNFSKEEEYSNEAEERSKFLFRLLRDPATNTIPYHVRQKELRYAGKLSSKNKLLKASSINTLQWKEAGPVDVGGRTRALAVDVANSNIIIAGGISGGIWKSTDNGNTWKMKSRTDQVLSVTSVAQDPRAGHTNTWFYCGGEFTANSASANGTAYFLGNGIYRSTDNGETWNVIPSTLDSNTAQWSSPYDNTSKIVVNPATGSVFVTSNGFGIFRSKDSGDNFSLNLGGTNEHIFSDVVACSNGTLVGTVSSPFQGITATINPGIYKSTNDGDEWTEITPNNFPSTNERTVLGVSAANPDIVYALTNSGQVDADKHEITKFYKITISSGASEDRSNNLPNFLNSGDPYASEGIYTSQGNYDMAIAVKPDDENFVLIAGTSLFRSTDGFSTKPTDIKKTWIGGYHPVYFGYPNFHPDIHSFSFDPNNPKKMWWGNDGGLVYTSDITNTSYSDYFPWENKNNGYNVTQFYMIAIPNEANDNRIMGGAQDNGTPFFTFDGANTSNYMDESSGDGMWAYFGKDFAYASVYNGKIFRLRYNQNNQPDWNAGESTIFPTDAVNQMFVDPYVIDPVDENIMYYPAGGDLWRNNSLNSIPDGQNGTTVGWTKLANLTLPQGSIITTLSASTSPAHVLYYASTDFNSAPKVYKLANANTATSGAVDISIPNVSQGAYIYNIAVNPDNADEIIVVMSNYNIVGLYHSTNGGQTYNAVEGNLEGTQKNPGPSLRCATILPTNNGTTYYLATSIGVFSTNQLNSNNTQWVQEGADVIGNVVSEYITSRKSDGKIIVGTHGRGAFVSSSGSGSAAALNLNVNQLNIEVLPNAERSTNFTISNPGGANLSFNISATGGSTNVVQNKPPEITLMPTYKMNNVLEAQTIKKLKGQSNRKTNHVPTSPSKVTADELVLDDGDAFADGYLGLGGTVYFYWRNDFQLTKDFSLEQVRFYMKTETANTNPMEIAVVSGTGTILVDTTFTTEVSSTGKWYDFQFSNNTLNNLKFQNGDLFSIVVISLNADLQFPAAYDDDGQVKNQSYYAYYDPSFGGYFSGWANLNALAANGAWLIRAVGNSGGGTTNQPPVAVAQVSPNPAKINESVSFNGSGSYDNDGQINSYLWEFGDNATSTQANAAHSFAQAGQYNYKLTVTDDKGATNQAVGQINVSDQSSPWTITPSSGNVTAGGQQNIKVTFNSQGLSEGNYQGQIIVNSNGGNMTIPVSILVSSTVDVKDQNKILAYKLEQNYPNPFNPQTTIHWSIPTDNNVKLKVYDIEGKEIATLVNGHRNAGVYNTIFDASSLASGVYFYRMQAGKYVNTGKMILMK